MADVLHPEPSPERLAAIAAYRPDGPFVALDLFHEVVAVWYPSRAAIDRAVLICCDGDPQATLTSPYGG